MKYRYILLLLATILHGEQNLRMVHASVYEPDELSQAYAYLNKLRLRADLTEFSQHPQLEKAAFNHANFLAVNSITGHYESEEMPGFTGISPKDRTIFEGYRSVLVAENVSSEQTDIIESIDNLMSAIYHRFGFLGFIKNEIGIGYNSQGNTYVYNMGNSGYNALCEGTSIIEGWYYFEVCEPNININATDFGLQIMIMMSLQHFLKKLLIHCLIIQYRVIPFHSNLIL